MAGLKACPFCGGKAYYYTEEKQFYNTPDYKYIVECENCEACVYSVDSEQQAIDAWNKRS